MPGTLEVFFIDDVEYVVTDDEAPWCDGDGGALGHPREFMVFERTSQILTCGYCSRRLVHRSHPDLARLRERAQVTA